jgi:DNA-binding CsgD family transcriptional regulator
VLADLCATLALAEQIPHYLSQVVETDSLTLAIVHQTSDASTLFLRVSSGLIADAENAELLGHQVLTSFHDVRNAGSLRAAAFDLPPSECFTVDMAVDLRSFPNALVLTRRIYENHHLMLMVHHRADELSLDERQLALLQPIAHQLSKLLAPLIIWHTAPEVLGEGFQRLTRREWAVLRGLYTEGGEKQLADELGMSPHTLHSHIKSIYRKMGVQGRLPLIAKVQAAFRKLRTHHLHRVAGAEMGDVRPTASAS